MLLSVDLPALAPVLNMKQYNGAYGCPSGEQSGTPRPNAKMVRNWPKETSVLRTHTSFVDAVADGIGENKVVSHTQHFSLPYRVHIYLLCACWSNSHIDNEKH